MINLSSSSRTIVPRMGCLLVFAVMVDIASAAPESGFATRCADRAAIERVYHRHRTGTKAPFEQAMPAAVLEKLVRNDLKKETVLKTAYDVIITPGMVETEVRRIDSTTRAPDILAEIKDALGDDPERFACGMARPIVVERELRKHFDHDDALHTPQRHEAEVARDRLLAGQAVEDMREVTWLLTPRPVDHKLANTTTPPPLTEASAKSRNYSVEATTQVAQPMNAAPGEVDQKLYFEDLDPELQNVLRAQLRKPGDVSAVIETPGGFLVYQAKATTDTALTASSLSIPKRSFDEWLAAQPND